MIIDSLDGIIKSAQEKGMMHRLWCPLNDQGATAATSTCGYQTWGRYLPSFTIPSMGAGISGAWMTRFSSVIGNSGVVCGLEYSLGTLTVSTNAFAAGVSMPTKTMRLNGITSSVVTATQRAFLVATAALTAATPTITITYTNQAGTLNRTATLVLPSNPVKNTAFDIIPHLQSGDTGIRAVTGISTSAGSAGSLVVYGLLVVGTTNAMLINSVSVDPILTTMPLWLMETNETLTIYQAATNYQTVWCAFSAVAEY